MRRYACNACHGILAEWQLVQSTVFFELQAHLVISINEVESSQFIYIHWSSESHLSELHVSCGQEVVWRVFGYEAIAARIKRV